MLVVINKDSQMNGSLCGKLHGGWSPLLAHIPPVIDPIARYSSKITIPPPLPTCDAPVKRSLSEYCHDIWYGKTRMMWIPDGEKFFKISLFISTESMNVTDRQTAWWHSIVWQKHQQRSSSLSEDKHVSQSTTKHVPQNSAAFYMYSYQHSVIAADKQACMHCVTTDNPLLHEASPLACHHLQSNKH